MNLDRGGADLEAAAARVKSKSVFDHLAVEFINLAAGFADLESRDTRMNLPMLRMTADDEGIQALKSMNTASLNQLVQRTVNLQRRFKSFIPQTVENPIGAQRQIGGLQHRQHEALIPRQFQIIAMNCLQHGHLRKVTLLGNDPDLLSQVQAIGLSLQWDAPEPPTATIEKG